MKDSTKKHPRIIALSSVKGGTGKSTLTVLLARQYAELGHRVLVVDLDPQASTTDYFCRTEAPHDLAASCSYHLVTERKTLAETIRTGMLGLDIVTSAPILAQAELELATDPGTMLRLRSAILEGGHDVVILDTPPALSWPMRAALYSADMVLAPIAPDRWTMQGLAMLTETLDKVRKTTGRPLELVGVPSIVSPREAETCRAAYADIVRLSGAAIPRSASVRRAINRATMPGRAVLEAVAILAADLVPEEVTA